MDSEVATSTHLVIMGHMDKIKEVGAKENWKRVKWVVESRPNSIFGASNLLNYFIKNSDYYYINFWQKVFRVNMALPNQC